MSIPYIDVDDDLEMILSSEIQEMDWKDNPVNIKTDDFVLVKFCTIKSALYYVGMIIRPKGDVNDEVEVTFMRKKAGICKFYFPDVCDTSVVEKSDIVIKLPAPKSSGGTERVKSLFEFNVNITRYNVH